MSDFLGKKMSKLMNNVMGTNPLPVFFKCMTGKTSSGYTFDEKIGKNFYAANKTRICKEFISIKCKNFRQECSWTDRVKNMSGTEDISN